MERQGQRGLARLGRRETHNVPLALGGATVASMKAFIQEVRHRQRAAILPVFPFIDVQRFVASAGAIKVKPLIGKRSEMAAANISITPALPKATQ